MERHEWLEWRHKGIGSSDAPAIMQVSGFGMTPLKLYEEKVVPFKGEDDSNQWIKDRGNEVEIQIRTLLNWKYNINLQPSLKVMEDYPFIKASTDGEDQGIICEIKLLGKEDFERGIVPIKYWPQVQHLLMVTGAKKCIFAAHKYDSEAKTRQMPTLESLLIIEVEPDHTYIGQLLSEEIKFWDHVQKKKPPVPTDQDYKRLTGLAPAAKKYIKLTEKMKVLEEQIEEVKKELLEAADRQNHSRYECSGLRIQQVSKVGNVDYKKVPELKGVDLEPYRKAGSVYWKISTI